MVKLMLRYARYALATLATVGLVLGIVLAAAVRRDSRGAHFRADFPECGPLETSAFTSITNGTVSMKPVAFTRVAPGETLLRGVENEVA